MKALATKIEGVNAQIDGISKEREKLKITLPGMRETVKETGREHIKKEASLGSWEEVEWGPFQSAPAYIDTPGDMPERKTSVTSHLSMTEADINALIREIEKEHPELRAATSGQEVVSLEGELKELGPLNSSPPVSGFTPVLQDERDPHQVDSLFRLQLLMQITNEQKGYNAVASQRVLGWLRTAAQRPSQAKRFQEIILDTKIETKGAMGLALQQCIDKYELPVGSGLKDTIDAIIRECCSTSVAAHKSEMKFK